MPAADPIKQILKENDRRRAVINAPFNPVTGEGSIGRRRVYNIPDFPIPTQYLPVEMMDEPFVKKLKKAGTVEQFITKTLLLPPSQEAFDKVVEQFTRIRCKYDFPFWAAVFIFVLSKIPGEGEILFKLNNAQRKLVTVLERQRNENRPIRLVLLKTRQWGGSTCIQLYMAWLQLVHKKGLNSIIVSQKKKTSFAIKAMYDRALEHYPLNMLHELGEHYDINEKKMINVGQTGDYKKVPQRDCTITIASYEVPDAIRGDAYALAHLSEVGLWEATEKKTADKVVRSAVQGVVPKPYTMIVYESTANGTGNFFHNEYLAAKDGKSQFDALFVSWKEVEWDSVDFDSDKEREEFAEWLYKNRNNDTAESDREEPGTYLWHLWETGARLEGLNWYIMERSKCHDHGDMASECPSDDIEAFTFSGRKVFPREDVEQFRAACRKTRWVGEVYGADTEGPRALQNVRFKHEEGGLLNVWADVEPDTDEERVTDRYLVVVDVCKGHTKNADFADILVLDRIFMMDGEPPAVVAEWHGHIDMDKLAWKAAQIAEYYNHALLVIESNTLETNNTKGQAEYILTLIREVYDNLYARKQSAEDIREKRPVKYGFHTNVGTKPVLIENLKTILRDHLYIEREVDCLDEYDTYIENEKGGWEAMEGYHDDRLMTRAIGLYICFREMELPRIVRRTPTVSSSKATVSAATLM